MTTDYVYHRNGKFYVRCTVGRGAEYGGEAYSVMMNGDDGSVIVRVCAAKDAPDAIRKCNALHAALGDNPPPQGELVDALVRVRLTLHNLTVCGCSDFVDSRASDAVRIDTVLAKV